MCVAIKPVSVFCANVWLDSGYMQMRQSCRFSFLRSPRVWQSGVCAVRGVQEFGLHESRLLDFFSILFAWFDSEYLYMKLSLRFVSQFFYVKVDLES